MKQQRFNLGTVVPAGIFCLLVVVPFWGEYSQSDFYVAFYARVLIYAIAVAALNLALGFGGLISLGHALFMGIGAYSVAIPSFYGIDNGWLHMAICLVASGVLGYITGAISLRTTGIGFIMITLAFAQMGYFLFVSLKKYGGDDGTSIANTSQMLGLDFGNVYTVYWAALVVLVLLTWWMARLRVSPFGMVLRGARQNQRRINAVGFQANSYLLMSYVLSAMICSVAGFLLANLNAFASPTTLSWIISGDLVVMLVIGGIGTVFGPLLGALAFLGMEELLKLVTTHWLAIFGLVIVVIGIVGKAGLAGLLNAFSVKRGVVVAPTPNKAAGDAHG